MKYFSNKNFLILLALILVFVYALWALYLNKVKTIATNPEKREIQQIQNQSKSDDLDSIEKDLNGTEFENLDRELDSIEKELS